MISLLVYTLKSAFVLTLLYLPYTLMLRKESFFRMNRVTLLTILMLALVLPLCDFPSLAIAEQPAVYDVHHRIIQIVQNAEASGPHSPVAAFKSFSWLTLIAFIYLIGVAIAFVIRLWQLFRIGKQIRGGCLWNEKQGEAMVYCHINDVAPFSWMRNIVISENDYLADGCREIMLHEKAHIFCRHSLDILLLTLVETLQWWNPIVYLFGSSLRDVHEYEADDHVLQQGISLHNYQNLLVKKALANTSYAFANNFNHSLIKKRLYMMNHPKSNPWLRSKVLYILPVTLVVLTAFATPKLNETVENVVKDFKQVVELQRPEVAQIEEPETKTELEAKVEPQEEELITDYSPTEPESEIKEEKTHGRELPRAFYQIGVQGKLPVFPGGASALRDYLKEHVNTALQSGITPTDEIVYVRFKVFHDGTIREIEVRSSVNEEVDLAAIQIVKEMPHWSPARDYNGEATVWSYTLPIQFNNQ